MGLSPWHEICVPTSLHSLQWNENSLAKIVFSLMTPGAQKSYHLSPSKVSTASLTLFLHSLFLTEKDPAVAN